MNNKTIVAAALVFAALATTACSEKKRPVSQPIMPYLPTVKDAVGYSAAIKYNTTNQNCSQVEISPNPGGINFINLSVPNGDTITWKGVFTDGVNPANDKDAANLEIQFAAVTGFNDVGTPFRSNGAPVYTLLSPIIGPLTPADTVTGTFTVSFAEVIDNTGKRFPCKPSFGGFGVHVTQ